MRTSASRMKQVIQQESETTVLLSKENIKFSFHSRPFTEMQLLSNKKSHNYGDATTKATISSNVKERLSN
ncbi:hypothetical protein BRADI_4g20962v3 [Brachypodium distachyon]|uniref:Uncharacterized protein n=1 Tax=Brachypodium distachyon TaxID=15368 RepID=A0A2K2CP31_BRADI|nr:hypothetical protein BRADI_4g20962v3 [Brachypodium distachyon]